MVQYLHWRHWHRLRHSNYSPQHSHPHSTCYPHSVSSHVDSRAAQHPHPPCHRHAPTTRERTTTTLLGACRLWRIRSVVVVECRLREVSATVASNDVANDVASDLPSDVANDLPHDLMKVASRIAVANVPAVPRNSSFYIVGRRVCKCASVQVSECASVRLSVAAIREWCTAIADSSSRWIRQWRQCVVVVVGSRTLR